MTNQSLRQRLQALRRRMLVIGGLTGVGLGIVGAIVVGLALVWLDLLWELSPELRIAAGGAALLAAGVVIVGVFVVWLRRSRVVSVARRLDRAGQTGGQILSGYDLEQYRQAPHAPSPLTGGLAVLATERASALADGIPASKVASTRPLTTTAYTVLGVAAAIVALAFAMPRLAQTQWLRFSDPYGDHPPYSRIVFQVQPGDTQVRYGSGMDVEVVTSGPPVERVELVLAAGNDRDEEALPMFPEPGGKWRATLTRVTASGKYFVRAARSRSERYAIDVITIPRLENVRFRVTPPEYTRRSAYEGPLPQGGLAGLPGTRVEMWIKSNRPLKHGSLTVGNQAGRSEHKLTPASTGSDEVTGSFVIEAAGKFSATVTDIAGTASQESFAAAITLLSDERPFIRIRQPPPISLATPSATLPVVMSGEDDYGIAAIQLFRSLNESRALPMAVQVPVPAATRFDTDAVLPLSAYGLEPGDVIKLFARIEDNDPAGAKGSESPLVEVRIISQEDFERMLRQQEGMEVLMSKYRQAQREMESLAAEVEALQKKISQTPDGKVSEESRSEVRKLADRLTKQSESLRKAAENLLPYDLDKNLVRELEKLADSLEHEAQQATELADQPMLTPEELAKKLEALRQALAQQRQELDREAMEPLEHFEKIFPLIEDQSRFSELYQKQRDLAERLASLKGRDNEDDPLLKGRMRDLETEQRKIHDELEQLLGDIETHAMQLPDDEKLDDLRKTALDFVDALRASGAGEAMGEAENGLAEFSGTRGHDGAQRAADALEKLLSKCNGMGEAGQGCLKFQPKLASCLGNTVAQLLAEMGMGRGPGMGSGDGFSSRRNSLGNIGLYGQMPGLERTAGSRSGRNAARSGTLASGTNRDDESTATDVAPGTLEASGAAGVAVPPRYRSRVGAYFQRVAEEGDQR